MWWCLCLLSGLGWLISYNCHYPILAASMLPGTRLAPVNMMGVQVSSSAVPLPQHKSRNYSTSPPSPSQPNGYNGQTQISNFYIPLIQTTLQNIYFSWKIWTLKECGSWGSISSEKEYHNHRVIIYILKISKTSIIISLYSVLGFQFPQKSHSNPNIWAYFWQWILKRW